MTLLLARRTGPLVGPIGLALHVDVVGHVDDAVEDRLGHDGVGEERVPVRGRPVGRDDEALAGPLGHEFVEVVGLGDGELTHGEVVEDQDRWPGPGVQPGLPTPIGMATGQVGQQGGEVLVNATL